MIQSFDSIIFDLDGTLWDSRQPVANARNNVVARLGLNLPEFTAADVQRTMGLPMDKVYQIAFPTVAPDDFMRVRQHLDAEIAHVVLNEGATLFPLVEATLAELHQRTALYLVSNCSTRYLATYFQWSGHQKYFRDSVCYGDNQLPKSENIRLIQSRNKLQNPVYIGDTSGDHQASLSAGVGYIHVNYGFGQPLSECTRIDCISRLAEI